MKTRLPGVIGSLLCLLVAQILTPCPRARAAEFVTAREMLSQEPREPDFRISYGEDALQFGGLRLPGGPGPYPVAVLIHGGCWLSFASLEYMDRFAEALTAEGIATWNLEYRRVDNPGGGWPNTFLDVGQGIDHLRVLEEPHNLDLERVVVVGHSSGGHLALWVAGRPRVPRGALQVSKPLPVIGAVCLAGPGDLAAFRPLDNDVCGGDVIDDLMGGSPEEVPENYRAGSPVRLLPLGVSQEILVGEFDQAVPATLLSKYAAAAEIAGDQVRLEVLENAAHFEPVAPWTESWPAVKKAVGRILNGRDTSPGAGP